MTVLGGECWDDTHKIEKCKQVCLSTHVDEVVPSRLLTRRGVSVVFVPSVRSVLVVAQSPFVCLCTIHVSAVSRLRPRSESDPAENCFPVDNTIDSTSNTF